MTIATLVPVLYLSLRFGLLDVLDVSRRVGLVNEIA